MSWGNQMYNAESVGPLPAGVYEAVIAKVEKQTYDASEFVNIQFKAQGGSAFERFYTAHSNPKAVSAGYGKMKQLVLACGWQVDDERKTLVKGVEEFTDPRCLQGQRVVITITETENNGKTYANVSNFKPAGGRGLGGSQYTTSADQINDGPEPFRNQF